MACQVERAASTLPVTIVNFVLLRKRHGCVWPELWALGAGMRALSSLQGSVLEKGAFPPQRGHEASHHLKSLPLLSVVGAEGAGAK